ncbi:MAG TPA: glycosyltransferase family 4 protein [Caldimonas sp.]|nr:glycosyltransferase family 4 protein [Caldimonas sp.]
MHVGLFAPAWPLRLFPNGIVTYVHAMREELQQQGHRVTVFASDVGEEAAGVHRLGGSLSFRALRWWRARARSNYHAALDWGIGCAADVMSVHRRAPIDVIEMEESFGWFADVARLTRIPTVVKLHGPAFMSLVGGEIETPFARARIDREGQALAGAPVITSPARRTLDETLARYRLSPAVARHVVNPLQLPRDAPLWRLEACERRTLLFVGRFDARKGGDLVLRAFARLLDEDPALKLIFVGPDGGVPNEGGHTVRFEAFVAQCLPHHADRVDYRGPLGPADICALRAKAYATLVASRWENQSYTALEAMLQGCPIVSSDAGGQPESVQHGITGLLAEAGSVDALCMQVRALLRDPALAAKLGAQARAHVLHHHAPERVVRETLEVYEQAIGRSRRRERSSPAALHQA